MNTANLTAAQAAARCGFKAKWAYKHKHQLGAIQYGNNVVRFDPERVEHVRRHGFGVDSEHGSVQAG